MRLIRVSALLLFASVVVLGSSSPAQAWTRTVVKGARATVDVVAANDSIATKARSKLRTSALRSLTRSLGKTMRSVLGNNVVGRLAGELVNDKGKAIAGQGGFTQAELECAKLAAFEQVRAQFTWAEERAGFVHRSAVDGSQAAR